MKKAIADVNFGHFIVYVSVVLSLVLFYFTCINYIEPSEVGIARNHITGRMWLQDKGGIYLTWPWVWVARIDTRPMRVAVTTAGKARSAKLVQFEQKHWESFVQTEGWRYYWWANRFSINFGYDEEYRGLRDIMRGYAYSTKQYPFIKILQEYEEK